MDPNACLKRFYDHVAAGEWVDAWDASEDLRSWLCTGGFQPDWGPGEAEHYRGVLSAVAERMAGMGEHVHGSAFY